MKFYFNGCSHTRGDELDNLNSAWPSIIAEYYKVDFINAAVSGGANDQILYQTVKNIENFDCFYIAWTYLDRFTRYRSDNNSAVNFNVKLTNWSYGHKSEYQDYGKLHYAHWHNQLYAFKIWLQSVLLLQKLFESKNKQYVMINATDNLLSQWTADWPNFIQSVRPLVCIDLMSDEQLYQEHVEIQNLITQLNLKNFIGWNTWHITKLKDKFPCGVRGHLLEQGHRAVADYILSNTKSLDHGTQ